MPISLKLRLPDPPPSVNRAWRMFRGHMVRSDTFKRWEANALYVFHGQVDGEKLPAWCYWRADIAIPRSKVSGDIDNLAKGLLDAVVRAGLTPDDRYVVDLRLRFWAGDHVIINLSEAETELWLKEMNASPATRKKMRQHSTWTPRA